MRVAAGGLVAAIAATFAVAAGAARVSTAGGVYGTVTKWPVTPVCTDGSPCSAPAAGVTVEAVQGSVVVAKTVTGLRGGYRIKLAPGTYRLRVRRVFKPASVLVTVRSGWVHKNLRYDTGIRAPSPGPTVGAQ